MVFDGHGICLSVNPWGCRSYSSLTRSFHVCGNSALQNHNSDHAFQQVVSAVTLGDGAKVSKALEAMHGTIEKTHEGVYEGTVRIPKNAHRQKEFVEMDKRIPSEPEKAR